MGVFMWLLVVVINNTLEKLLHPIVIEHFCKCKTSAIYTHQRNCDKCVNGDDCSVVFVENYLDRGKYTLSEREYLKNKRNFEYSKKLRRLNPIMVIFVSIFLDLTYIYLFILF